MLIQVNTGEDARVEGAEAVDGADLGVRFSSFRTLDRFDQQLEGIRFGMISWPGGYLAEADTERFGLQYDGLYNPAFGQPGLSDMIDFANDHDAGISIVVPTIRYAGHEAQMRADVRGFMTDLLSGHYGQLPDQVILHIGSEYYHHFDEVFDGATAVEYGAVASAMVNEINACLSDPTLNPEGRGIDVSVQAGRDMAEDEEIRDAFSQTDLASVDLVMHHRYPGSAEGVGYTLNQFEPIYDAWVQDVTAAGGDRPELHLSEWGVATVTRDEGLSKYIRDMRAEGITVHRDDVDLDGRTTTDFENYWQDLLGTRDYGIEQPRLYLELFSEYQATGMGAASLHSWDMVHAGRDSYVDVDGNPVQFVGAELIDMLYESVNGLTVMDISTENARNSDLWTYGYENDDRLVMFLSADDDATVGRVTLDIEGLGTGYQAIWVEGLVADVPDDWMERFGVIDNPDVDESTEGNTYAIGLRSSIEFDTSGDTISFSIDSPGEVVRIMVARTPEEAEQIAQWAGVPHVILNDETDETGSGSTLPDVNDGSLIDDPVTDDDHPQHGDPAPATSTHGSGTNWWPFPEGLDDGPDTGPDPSPSTDNGTDSGAAPESGEDMRGFNDWLTGLGFGGSASTSPAPAPAPAPVTSADPFSWIWGGSSNSASGAGGSTATSHHAHAAPSDTAHDAYGDLSDLFHDPAPEQAEDHDDQGDEAASAHHSGEGKAGLDAMGIADAIATSGIAGLIGVLLHAI